MQTTRFKKKKGLLLPREDTDTTSCLRHATGSMWEWDIPECLHMNAQTGLLTVKVMPVDTLTVKVMSVDANTQSSFYLRLITLTSATGSNWLQIFYFLTHSSLCEHTYTTTYCPFTVKSLCLCIIAHIDQLPGQEHFQRLHVICVLISQIINVNLLS